jgi:hypothetical protein
VADTPPREQFNEVKDLLIAYAKQETIDPLKGLARYVGFGLLGSLLIGTGICFLAVGGLRALQTETGTTFRGHWSWAPYGITVFGLLMIAVAAIFMARSPRSSR